MYIDGILDFLFVQWIPVTKLGRLVKDGKIKRLEDIYLFSMPIKVRMSTYGMLHVCFSQYNCLLFRKQKLSIGSLDLHSRMKSSRLCQFRSKHELVNVLGSKP